jgi:hypothetical protein
VSSGIIVPVASCLYLVDGSIGYPGGKTDLMGIFNRINTGGLFPHVQSQFVVYARLVQGLGQVPFHIAMVDAATLQVIHRSPENILHFPYRDRTVELAMTFQGITFPVASTYLVELWCDTQWVADARLELI